jgi:hypothetical protein
MELRAWTDCPIPELGDTPGRTASVREAIVVDYDGGDHATAIVGGKPVRIEVRFLYVRKGAAEKAPALALRPASRHSSSALDSAYVRIKSSGLNAPTVITKRRGLTP